MHNILGAIMLSDRNNDLQLFQLTGTSDKLDAFLRALADATVLEVVRSGVSGLSRGEKVLSI